MRPRHLLITVASVALWAIGAHAQSIDNDNGFYADDFGNDIGVELLSDPTFSSNVARAALGNEMRLGTAWVAPPACCLDTSCAPETDCAPPPPVTGFFTTVPIEPISFLGWKHVLVDYRQLAPGQVLLDLYAVDPAQPTLLGTLIGTRALVPSGTVGYDVQAAIDDLPAATYKALRLRFRLSAATAIGPAIEKIRVTWAPKAELQVNVGAPTSVPTNSSFTARLESSVSYVQANDYVLYLPLPYGVTPATVPNAPGFSDDTTLYPGPPGEGGAFHPGPGNLILGGGVTIPPRSVYWGPVVRLAGETFAARVNLKSAQGILSGTSFTLKAFAKASNSPLAESAIAPVTVSSGPSPRVFQNFDAIYIIDGIKYSYPARTVRLNVSGNNHTSSGIAGGEVYWESFVWADLAPVLADPGGPLIATNPDGSPLITNATGAPLYSGPTGITIDGFYVPPYSLYWDTSDLRVGEQFSYRYSLTLLDDTPDGPLYEGQPITLCSHLESDFRTTVDAALGCDTLVIGVPDDPRGYFAKGVTVRGNTETKAGHDDLNTTTVEFGERFAWALYASNTGVSALSKIVMLDMVPDRVTLDSVVVPSGVKASVHYYLGTAYTNPQAPPPMTADGDPAEPALWTTTLPANRKSAKWVRIEIAALASKYFPTALFGAPVSATSRIYVTVDTPSGACEQFQIHNYGHSTIHGYWPAGSEPSAPPLPGDPPFVPDDDPGYTPGTAVDFEMQEVRPRTSNHTGNVHASASPTNVLGAGTVNYTVSVGNYQPGGSPTGPTRNANPLLPGTEVTIVLPRATVNGVPDTVFSLAGGVTTGGGTADLSNVLNGIIKVTYPTIAAYTSAVIRFPIGVPKGLINGTSFDLTANVVGYDPYCGTTSDSRTATAKATVEPALYVSKRVDFAIAGPNTDLNYDVTWVNYGDGAATKVWVVDRLSDKVDFLWAEGPPGGTAVWFSNTPPPALPAALTNAFSFDEAAILANFTKSTTTDQGGRFLSPLANPTYVAWQVTDPATSPPVLRSGSGQGARMRVRVKPGLSTNTIAKNDILIDAAELLQSIGPRASTLLSPRPSLSLSSECGQQVMAGGEATSIALSYYNDSTNANSSVSFLLDLGTHVELFDPDDGGPLPIWSHTWNGEAITPSDAALPSHATDPVTLVDLGGGQWRVDVIEPGDPYLGKLQGGSLLFNIRVVDDPQDPVATGDLLPVTLAGTAVNGAGTFEGAFSCEKLVSNPDIWVRKAVDQAAPPSNTTVDYTILIKNAGSHFAPGVIVTDTLPPGMTYVSALLLGTGWTGQTPTVSPDLRTLTWPALTKTGLVPPVGVSATGFFGAGDEIAIAVRALIGSVGPGFPLENCAVATTTMVQDPDYADVGCVTVTTPYPDLRIRKTSPAQALPGARVSFDIEVANIAREPALNAVVIDRMPWVPNDLGPTASAVHYVASRLPAGASIYFHSSPLGAHDGTQSPPWRAATVVPVFDRANPTTFGWRSTPTPPVNWIAIVLPTPIPALSADYRIGIDVDLKNASSGRTPLAGTTMRNCAEARMIGPGPTELIDNDDSNDVACASVTTPGTDLSVAVLCDPGSHLPGSRPGDLVRFTSIIENTGTTVAYGVHIYPTLPQALSLDRIDPQSVAVTDSAGQPSRLVDADEVAIERTVGWQSDGAGGYTVGQPTGTGPDFYRKLGLLPGNRVSLTFIAEVDTETASGSQLVNEARVSTDYREDFNINVNLPEEYLVNNLAGCGFTVWRPDLFVEKEVVKYSGSADEGLVNKGDVVTYTLSVGNLGAREADGLVLEDLLPRGLSFVPGSLAGAEGATVQYANSQFNWAHVPGTGATDPSVRGVRVTWDGPFDVSGDGGFSHTTATQFASGSFDGTATDAGLQAVVPVGAEGLSCLSGQTYELPAGRSSSYFSPYASPFFDWTVHSNGQQDVSFGGSGQAFYVHDDEAAACCYEPGSPGQAACLAAASDQDFYYEETIGECLSDFASNELDWIDCVCSEAEYADIVTCLYEQQQICQGAVADYAGCLRDDCSASMSSALSDWQDCTNGCHEVDSSGCDESNGADVYWNDGYGDTQWPYLGGCTEPFDTEDPNYSDDYAAWLTCMSDVCYAEAAADTMSHAQCQADCGSAPTGDCWGSDISMLGWSSGNFGSWDPDVSSCSTPDYELTCDINSSPPSYFSDWCGTITTYDDCTSSPGSYMPQWVPASLCTLPTLTCFDEAPREFHCNTSCGAASATTYTSPTIPEPRDPPYGVTLWDAAQIDLAAVPVDGVTIDVLDVDGVPIPGLTAISLDALGRIGLADLPAAQYPQIKLRANFAGNLGQCLRPLGSTAYGGEPATDFLYEVNDHRADNLPERGLDGSVIRTVFEWESMSSLIYAFSPTGAATTISVELAESAAEMIHQEEIDSAADGTFITPREQENSAENLTFSYPYSIHVPDGASWLEEVLPADARRDWQIWANIYESGTLGNTTDSRSLRSVVANRDTVIASLPYLDEAGWSQCQSDLVSACVQAAESALHAWLTWSQCAWEWYPCLLDAYDACTNAGTDPDCGIGPFEDRYLGLCAGLEADAGCEQDSVRYEQDIDPPDVSCTGWSSYAETFYGCATQSYDICDAWVDDFLTGDTTWFDLASCDAQYLPHFETVLMRRTDMDWSLEVLPRPLGSNPNADTDLVLLDVSADASILLARRGNAPLVLERGPTGWTETPLVTTSSAYGNDGRISADGTIHGLGHSGAECAIFRRGASGWVKEVLPTISANCYVLDAAGNYAVGVDTFPVRWTRAPAGTWSRARLSLPGGSGFATGVNADGLTVGTYVDTDSSGEAIARAVSWGMDNDIQAMLRFEDATSTWGLTILADGRRYGTYDHYYYDVDLDQHVYGDSFGAWVQDCDSDARPRLDAWKVDWQQGATREVSFRASVDDRCASNIDNSASASTETQETTLANNTGTVGLGVNAVSLTATVKPSRIAASRDDEITYTYSVANAGPGVAHGVVLTGTWPKYDAIGGGDYVLDTLVAESESWTLGDIPPGQTVERTVTAPVRTDEPNLILPATAAVTTTTIECDRTATRASGQTLTGSWPNVAIGKTGPGSVEVSTATPSLANYTLTWESNGNDAALGVNVTDTLPPGTRCVAANPAPTSGVCAPGSTDTTLGWALGTQPAGASGEIEVTLEMTGCDTVGQTLNNLAEIGTLSPEADITDNQGIASTFLTAPLGELRAQIFPDVFQVADGGTRVRYVVHYSNVGAGEVTQAALTAPLPGNATFIAGSASAGAVPSGGTLTWALGTLAAGESGSVAFVLEEAGAVGDSIASAVPLTLTGVGSCLFSAALPEVAIVAPGGLEIVKVASQSALCGGQGKTLTWTIAVVNRGPVSRSGVVVSDAVPGGLTYLGGSITGPGASAIGAPSLVWSVGTLAPNQGVTLTYVTSAPALAQTMITNTAAVSASGVATVVSAPAAVYFDCGPAVALQVSASQACGLAGRDIIMTLSWRNRSAEALTGAVISDLLPASLSYISSPDGLTHSGEPTGGTVSFVRNIAAFGTGSASFVVRPAAGLATGTLISNHATLAHGETLAASNEAVIVAITCAAAPSCRSVTCTDAGTCLYPADTTQNGNVCDDNSACTDGDVCSNGVCAGQNIDCNDNKQCTSDSCDIVLGCQNLSGPLDGTACIDGNACTEGEVCANGTCAGGLERDCSDTNVCTSDSCDPVDGCINQANSLPCSDGNACTVDDTCDGTSGTCVSGAALDCDDGNQCTSEVCDPVLACVVTLRIGQRCDDLDTCTRMDTCTAVLDGQGAVTSARCTGDLAQCNDFDPCTIDSCVSGTGCVFTPGNDGASCDDLDRCTTGDICGGGECQGAAVQCAGTAPNGECGGSCDPDSGDCVYEESDGSQCDDNDACTEDDSCSGGACEPGGDLDCDDSYACTEDTCDALTGCANEPRNDQCDDGATCTDDFCDPEDPEADGDGCAVLHDDTPCADSFACTAGWCEPGGDGADLTTGCVLALDDEVCDDGLDCTSEVCDPSNGGRDADGCVATADDSACDDGFACTLDRCDPVLGCVSTPDETFCDDGASCTIDFCDPDDGDADPDGCAVMYDDAPCVDSFACTDSWCEPDGNNANGVTGCVVELDDDACDDGNDCSTESCDPAGLGHDADGCVATLDDGECEDGFDCTIDVCDRTLGCVVTIDDAQCDDGASCTDDFCDPDDPDADAQGCAALPDDAQCGDSFACTDTWCDPDGDGAHGATGCVVERDDGTCDDGFDCTTETCDPSGSGHDADGCVATPDDGACDDGFDCTTERCELGMGCVATPDHGVCDDGFSCTDEACDPDDPDADGTGCVVTPDDVVCDDQLACTEDSCDPTDMEADAETGCLRQADDTVCDDGYGCTLDLCDADDAAHDGDGCVATPMQDYCDDGVTCTTDSCEPDSGDADPEGCVFDTATAYCDDGYGCTLDACDPDNGDGDGCAFTPDETRCDDGFACTDNVCDPLSPGADGEGCDYPPDSGFCGDALDCTIDTCLPGALGAGPDGCVATPDDLECDDGYDCTIDRCDAALGCQVSADDSFCGDGYDCTTDRCDPGGANDATGCAWETNDDACDNGDACTEVACVIGEGCVSQPMPDDTPCSDANACTSGDSCIGGRCEGASEECATLVFFLVVSGADGQPIGNVRCEQIGAVVECASRAADVDASNPGSPRPRVLDVKPELYCPAN